MVLDLRKRIKWLHLAHSAFWISFMTALLGSFEMAFEAAYYGPTASPIFSGTFGYPILHHYLIGFIGIAIFYTYISKDHIIEASKKIQKYLYEGKRKS